MRGSPALYVLDKLRSFGFNNIYGHDFVVSDEDLLALNVVVCDLTEGFKDADCVLIMNSHPQYQKIDLADLEVLVNSLKKGALFYDSWHLFGPEVISLLNGKISYEGLGVTTVK